MFKYPHPSIVSAVRYTKIIITLLMLTGLVWVALFLHNNLYKPITQAMITAELKTKVILTTINKKGLAQVIDLIDKNKKLPALDWSSITDPFTISGEP